MPNADENKPSVIFMVSDNQGYGDVSAFKPNSKTSTPAIDSLANKGVIFTDSHSASSVCTPTRYGVLSARYPWRTHLQKGVSAKTCVLEDGSISVGGEPLINKNTLTVAQFLKIAKDTIPLWLESGTFDLNNYYLKTLK